MTDRKRDPLPKGYQFGDAGHVSSMFSPRPDIARWMNLHRYDPIEKTAAPLDPGRNYVPKLGD